MNAHPIPCVGVVCLRGPEVLLIRRRNPPGEGQWSIPGGRLELGETLAQAALRELKEETGVEAELLGLIDVLDHFSDVRQAVLIDYAARWTAGEPRPGDDATEARFIAVEEAVTLVDWEETRRVILAGAVAARFGG
jgi:8-oxo-dGTP diphosphatase